MSLIRLQIVAATAFALVFTPVAQAQPIPNDGHPDVLVGSGPGDGLARLLSGVDGSELASGYPFGLFTGGVRVATGDINGDGTPDLVVGTGPGAGSVHVYDGTDATEIARFMPCGPDFRGGMYVATGDIDGDGRANLLVGAGTGSGLVRVYSGATHAELASGAPFGPLYTGGITVATGDVNGDGQVDVIAGTAIGGLVRIFNGASVPELASGFPYGPTFMGGVYVAAGDVDGDGRAEVITGARSAIGVVRVFDGTGSVLASFEPFGASDGVSVAAGDLTGDGRADVVTGAGAGVAPRVRAFRGPDGLELLNGLAFDPAFRGGVFVATTAEVVAGRFTSPNAATFEVGSDETFTVTTAGRVTPITVTGALPDGVTFTDHADGTATLAGTPAAGTGAVFALTFRGGPGGTITQTFTLTVNEAPAVSSATTTTFLVGTAGTFTVLANGFPDPTITSVGVLPDGVTVTDNGDGTATLAGTPGAGTGGTYALTFTATNGIGPAATQSFSLVVQQAPAVTSAATTTFGVGAAGTFAVTTSGVPAVTSLVRGGAPLPAGVTFTDHGDGTGTLAGTPAAGTGGDYAITFTADNGVGTPVVQAFTLRVTETLAITSANTVTFGLGTPSTFAVTTTGFPRPSLTRAGAALPAGVTFTDNGDGSATLAGTPAAGTGGTYAFTITAANGVSTDVVQSFTLTVNQAPTFTSAAATTFTVGTAGAFAVTTTGTPAVTTLALAGTLPSGVTFVDNGNGTGALSGTPGAGTGGTYAVTFTATNGVHAPVVQSFVLTVTDAPAITSAASTTFALGAAGTFTVTTTAFPVASLTRGGAALPSGVTFVDNGDGTGTLAGTPAAGTGGTYALTFTAANGIGADAVQNFTLTVDSSPAFTSAAATTFTVGTAGTFSITTTGSPAVTAITLGGVALPTGVTFTDNGDGTATLAGTPAAGTGGTYALTFTATNGVHAPAVQNFTLTVHQAPAITSAAATTFTAGAAGSFTVTTSGFPAPSLTIGGAALPSGVTFVDNGNGTATVSGTPAAGTGGTYALTFTATNGVAPTAVQSFTLTVNQTPVITSAASTTFTVGTLGTFTVTTTGLPSPALTITGTLPAGVSVVDNGNGTATLAGTPAAGTGGAYTLTITATNSSGTGTQTFTLTVNEAPAVTSPAATTFVAGTAGTFTVTTSGFPAPAIAIGGAALPGGVTFVDNGNGTGTLAGTPAAGTGGTYAVTFTASNTAGASAPQAFTLTVHQAPAITSAATTTFAVGTPGTFTVTTTGLPTPALSATGVLPAGVTFTDNGNGTATLSGTPTVGGTFPLTMTATNGIGANAIQAFTLSVNAPPAITSAAAVTFVAGTPGTFSVTTTGFPAAAIAIGGAALPGGVTFVDNGNGTGTLAGTPAAGTGGTYAVTFTASNTAGASAPQAFTLTVHQAPAITSAATTTFAVGTAGTFTVTTTGLPTPALSATGVLPAGVTFTDNGNGTATLSGTPTAGGSFPLTITASNGIGANATQAFTLSVNAPPAITSAAATTFVVGTPGTFTVTTTGSPVPSIVLSGAALPGGVTFIDNGNGTGTLAGTPAAGTGGSYAITFTAANGIGANAVQGFTLTVNQAPAVTSAASTTFQVGVAGTFTVTTTAFPVAAITRTGPALPGGVTFVDNGNGTATLSGTPAAGTAGTYAFTFTAANGVVPDGTQAFTLTVQQAPAITSGSTDTFTVGTADSFTVTTTGFPTPTVSHTGTLPAGITFTPATRVLGGTATQTGAFPLVFTATNGVAPDATQNFTLNVVCPAITVNPAALPDGLFQTAYGPTNFTQTGSTGSSVTWAATGLPAGLSINPTSGAVSGTPTNTVLNGLVDVTVTDNFGCVGTRSTTITVRPTTDPETLNGGVGHTQFVFGAALPATPHVFVNDNVKTGDNGPGALTVTFPATSANGVIVEGATDGTFTYTPNLNFAGPTDTFSYVLTDGNGVTNTGLVTINLSNLVWYVNSAAANGDGRSHNPFNTLANAATPSAAGSTIYVHTGGATTTGNLAMDANQVLFGQGAIFTLNSLTIPAAARPTLTGTVTLANNTGVTAVNFSGASPALTASATSFSLPVAINQVNVSGGTSALSLTNVTATATGAVSVSNASFTNTSAAEVLISGGNIPVTLAATVTISSNAGRSIDIQSRTGGTVSFAGPITDTGTGIILNANTGSTIAFTGGLALSTGGNAAFTATGGGTVTATQNNTTIVNTITTTTGTGLNVANTTIGASGLTFRSISANGAANGIILNNTGAAAGLTVTGNAGTCISAATCTGGAIQNTTGDGLALASTRTVSLTRLFVGTAANHGLHANAVNGLTLSNSFVQDNGNGDNEHGLNLVNAAGTVTIDATTFSGASEDLIHLENNNTNVTFTVTNSSQFTYPASVGAFANSAMLLLPGGTASITASIQNSTFTNVRNAAVQIGANLLNSSGTQNLTFSNNTLNVTMAGRGSGVVVSGQELTTTNIMITNNNFSGAGGNGVISIDTNDSSRVEGTVSGNQITSPPGIGMFVAVDEAAVNDIVLNNNTITNSGGDGIQAVNFGGAGTSTMQLAITNNQIAGHSANTAVSFVGGISFTGFEDMSCVAVRGNTVTGTPASPTQCGGAPCVDYYLEEVGGALTLEEIPNTASTTANAAYVNSINDTGPVTIFGVIDLTNGAACSVAPLSSGLR